MRRLGSFRMVGLATAMFAAALVGCGDDDDDGGADAAPGGADARLADGGSTPDGGGTADAASTADAAQPTHSGSIAVHEVALLDNAQAGRGGQVSISFTKLGVPSAGSASRPGALPCSATLTDTTIAAQNNPDLDEGVLKIEVKTAAGAASTTVIPDCAFSAQLGGEYRCLSTAPGGGGTLAATGNPAVFTFTPGAATTFSAAMVGNYLLELVTPFRAMPIVGANASTLGIQGGTGAAAGAVGSWVVAAGIGPVALTANPDGSNPGAPPEFLANTDKVKVTLMTKSGQHFTPQATSEIDVGDAFDLDAATVTLLGSDLNLATTTPLTFGCSQTGDRACGASTGLNGTLVVIDSTDATSFASDSDMGTPTRFTGSLLCAELGPTVTIPANLLNVLNGGHPTKLRISVFRDSLEPLVNTSNPRNTLNVVAGHGLIKFQRLND